MQVVPLVEVLLQRGVGVVPVAEVAELAADLVGPATGGMREQGKPGYGFFVLFMWLETVDSVAMARLSCSTITLCLTPAGHIPAGVVLLAGS